MYRYEYFQGAAQSHSVDTAESKVCVAEGRDANLDEVIRSSCEAVSGG